MRWARFDEVSAWTPVNPHRIPSRGHGAGRYVLDLRVDPAAREAYLALIPGTALPSGSVVAAFHRDERRGQDGPVYVMQKRGDSWSFSVLDRTGRPTEQGTLALCQRCHAEAVSDSLFGLPKASEPRE